VEPILADFADYRCEWFRFLLYSFDRFGILELH
jgi:hypothetical protein